MKELTRHPDEIASAASVPSAPSVPPSPSPPVHNNNGVPLNRALDSMCLAYNPLTRQLHFLPAKVTAVPVPVAPAALVPPSSPRVPVSVSVSSSSSSDGSVSSAQSSLSLSGDEDLVQDTNTKQTKKKGLAGLFTRYKLLFSFFYRRRR